MFLGTSSDRIGSPEGTQAYYVTVAKYLPVVRTAPYASLNYSEWDEGWNIPFGATVELGGGFSLRPMYDGQRTHFWPTYHPALRLLVRVGVARARRRRDVGGILRGDS